MLLALLFILALRSLASAYILNFFPVQFRRTQRTIGFFAANFLSAKDDLALAVDPAHLIQDDKDQERVKTSCEVTLLEYIDVNSSTTLIASIGIDKDKLDMFAIHKLGLDCAENAENSIIFREVIYFWCSLFKSISS